MASNELSRRKFIGKTAAGIAGATVLSKGSTMTAASYKRIIGANDRINIGFLGCGARGRGHQDMVKMSEKNKNVGVVALSLSSRIIKNSNNQQIINQNNQWFHLINQLS